MVLPNEIHGFLRHESWVAVLARGNAFLLDHLSRQVPPKQAWRVATPARLYA